MSAAVAGAKGWMWNPAGADDLLGRACEELKSGRFGLASESLRECRRDFGTRSRRSALLASVAATVDAVDHWVREEPQNPDALLMAARTAVVRSRRAADRAVQGAEILLQEARQACETAARAYPRDPTPWVAYLMLAPALAQYRLHTRQNIVDGRKAYEAYNNVPVARHPAELAWNERVAAALSSAPRHRSYAPRHRPAWRVEFVAEALKSIFPVGPWDLMFEVWERDPLNREAHHRMLECLPVSGAHEFAVLIANATARTDALQLLPLAAILADYRRRSANPGQPGEGTPAGVWDSTAVRGRCRDLYEGWFAAARAAGGPPQVTDYSLLAHALVKAGEAACAAQVMEAMKPYAATFPWSVTSGGPGEREFTRVAEMLHVPPPRSMSGWEQREMRSN